MKLLSLQAQKKRYNDEARGLRKTVQAVLRKPQGLNKKLEVAMLKSRRDFLKKSAVVAGTAAVGTSAMAMSGKSKGDTGSNGVVVGQSPKKEITYKKTAAWEEYYKQAL